MGFRKGEIVGEGKTKRLFSVVENPGLVIVENKSEITAFDDPAYTKRFAAKARYATQTTCRVFELLKNCGLPVAYAEQLSETEFLAPKVKMIPLEVIARRLAVGSFLDRRPDFRQTGLPHRFHVLKTELFLKTTKGKISVNGEEVFLGLPEIPAKEGGTKPLDDPLILDPHADLWKLFMPKKPAWEKSADLGINFDPQTIAISQKVIKEMDNINRQAFLILEAGWANLGFRLIDWKIEFGWLGDQLVIADVIDNDSWRLRDRDFQEVSKQAFRDGEKLDDVEAKYGYVANMVNQFRLPRQALVIWRGSPDDKLPEVPKIPGVEVADVVLSGHKKTMACLTKLEELQRDYPDGGVIIAVVGMSNGLGPVLSSHTTWPVIGVPVSAKEFPDDVWSSLRLPSQNPMATILSDKNAVLLALNILGQKNPAAYMARQFAIEQLDTGY